MDISAADVERWQALVDAIEPAAWNIGIRSNFSNYESRAEIVVSIYRRKSRSLFAEDYDLVVNTAEMENICRTDLAVTREFIAEAPRAIRGLLAERQRGTVDDAALGELRAAYHRAKYEAPPY